MGPAAMATALSSRSGNGRAGPAPLSWLVGAVLALSYVIFLVPWPYWLPLLAAVALVPAYALWRHGMQVFAALAAPGMQRLDYLALFLIGANVIAVAYGISATTDYLYPNVYREIGVGISILLLFFLVFSYVNHGILSSRDVLIGFLCTVILFAIPAALLGLIKYAFANDAYYLEFLIRTYPDFYPWGTSIKADYNFYGMSLLSAACAVYALWLWRGGSRWSFVLAVLAMAFLIAVALNAGSRRVLVSLGVAAVLLVVREVAALLLERRRSAASSLSLLGAVTLLVLALVSVFPKMSVPGTQFANSAGLVLDRNQAERLAAFLIASREEPEEPEIAEETGSGAASRPVRKSTKPLPFTVDTSISQRFDAIVDNKNAGLAVRLEMWQLGVAMAHNMNLLTGIGFDYQRVFSCRFSDCYSLDYPHNPLISHLLFAGAIGFLACLAFFLSYGLLTGFMYLNYYMAPIAIMLITNILFSMITGDTMFAIPTVFTLSLLAWLVLRSGGRIPPVPDAMGRRV